MTLFEIIRRIEATAAKQPAVNMIVENDIFKLNACADARYGVFAWTQGAHTASTESDERRYQFSLFYVDRLTDNGGNQLQVQSVAVEVLNNILRELAEDWGVEDWTIQTFNQRFTDVCSGAFASVVLSVPLGSVCAEDYEARLLGDFNIDFNNDFFVRKELNTKII